MGGRNNLCLRNLAENMKGRADLRHVEEYTQTLLQYSVVDSIYTTQEGKNLKFLGKHKQSFGF